MVLCAFVIGLSNVLPDIMAIHSLSSEGSTYYPFVFGQDETNTTGPRIRDVLDGHYIVSDVDAYEYKDYPTFWPPLPPLMHYPFLVLTGDIVSTVVASNFIFPVFIFFLLFYLAYIITKKNYLSLFFASFFSLYHRAALDFPPMSLNHLKDFFKVIFPFDVGSNHVAVYLTSRESFIPALTIFLLAAIFIYLNYRYNKKIYIILAGIFYALNAYSYPFHFIYLSAALCVLFFILLIQKKWDVIKRVVLSLLISLIFLIPFIYNQVNIRALPQYAELFERSGIEETYAFRFSYWREYLWYLLLALIALKWGKKNSKQAISHFVISFLLAGILVLNMQVVLGFNVQPDHWETRSIFFGLSLGWLVIFWWLRDYFYHKAGKKFIISFVAVAIIISLGFHSVQHQINNHKINYQTRTLPEHLHQSLVWLDENTDVDSVVVSPYLDTNFFIPMYTHNNIFIPRAVNTLASEQEIIDRLIFTYKLFGVTREDAGQMLRSRQTVDYLFSYRYLGSELDTYTKYAKSDPKIGMPEHIYTEIMEKFDSFQLEDFANKYRTDYLYLGPNEREISFPDFSEFDQVYNNEGVEIYQYSSENLFKSQNN